MAVDYYREVYHKAFSGEQATMDAIGTEFSTCRTISTAGRDLAVLINGMHLKYQPLQPRSSTVSFIFDYGTHIATAVIDGRLIPEYKNYALPSIDGSIFGTVIYPTKKFENTDVWYGNLCALEWNYPDVFEQFFGKLGLK